MALSWQTKIKKATGEPSDVEKDVAQALWDLQTQSQELKTELASLYIVAVKAFDVSAAKRALVVFVPFPMLKTYRKIHSRLVRELEKKFTSPSTHFLIVGQRRILPKPGKGSRAGKQKRPRSRTLTAVHDAILDDVVFPAEVIGRRTKVRLDTSKQIKVFLDPKFQTDSSHKLDSYSKVYKGLTGKQVTFDYPVQEA